MKAPVLIALLLAGSAGLAQTVKNVRDTPPRSRKDLFIESAMALPRLYESRNFDAIQHYVDLREQRSSEDADVFAMKIMLAMERNAFTKDLLPRNELYDILEDYADAAKEYTRGRFHLSYYSSRYFDATRYDKDIFGTTTTWARHLLNAGRPDSVETFLCHVFAGDIPHPNAAIKAGKEKYPALDSLLIQSGIIYRNSRALNLSLGLGVWAPSGSLSGIGVHPSIDLSLIGIRNKWNELDWLVSVRLLSSANDYTVLRNNTLYTRNYFVGGYIGLDYTRYLVHSFHFESGPVAGMGYDGFGIASQPKGSHENDYLSPLNIKSFNGNLGWRFNYFVNPHFYLGLAAKYNFINYCNPGGTPLDGNAVSVSLYAGINEHNW